MESTSASLLMRLKSTDNSRAWSRFVKLYTPLIYFWARNCGLQAHDASDLVQEVFALLLKKLPEFDYDKAKSFRGWLRTVTLNKWRDRYKVKALPVENCSQSALGQLVDDDPVNSFWEAEYQQQLVNRAIDLMKSEFSESTWKACQEYVIKGRPAADVANELNISIWTIYAAKSRLLNRLRQELDGLL